MSKSKRTKFNSDGWAFATAYHGFALLKPLSNSLGATRDHESGVSQQSLARYECADWPFGLMPCGIAKANHRIRPSGLLLHPDTKTGFARHENSLNEQPWIDLRDTRNLFSRKERIERMEAGESSFHVCRRRRLFVSRHGGRPKGRTRRGAAGGGARLQARRRFDADQSQNAIAAMEGFRGRA